MDISQFNYWWINKRVHPDLLGRKRQILDELISYLNRRQVILLTGIRRVGKTTLMYLLIDYLITNNKTAPYNIFYFSFDQKIESLAGRVFDFHINPLDFPEYLEFKKISIDYDHIEIFKPIIEQEIQKFMLTFVYNLVDFPQLQLKAGMLIEKFFSSCLNAQFFYRSTTKQEVDFIQTEPEIIPIEIKFKNNIVPSDLRGIKSFMNRYKCNKGIIVSKSEESEIKNTLGSIKVIPYWKMLIKKYSMNFTAKQINNNYIVM